MAKKDVAPPHPPTHDAPQSVRADELAPPQGALPEEPPDPNIPHVGTLPAGVVMHTGAPPPQAPLEHREEREPRQPPAGWVGPYERCGACGDFLEGPGPCPRCAPAAPTQGPTNAIATPPKMMADNNTGKA